MNRIAHSFAVFGAASQVLIPISFVVSQTRLDAALSGMDLSQPSDAQHVMSSVNTTISQMGSAFDFLLWVFGFAMLALVLFIGGITRLRYRRKWAFWFSCIYGGCLACIVPFGTPFGLFLLIYALIHRQEFLPSAPTPAISPA
jgi:hypothetical protein